MVNLILGEFFSIDSFDFRALTWEHKELEHLESKNVGPIKFFIKNNKIRVFAFFRQPYSFLKKKIFFQKNLAKVFVGKIPPKYFFIFC